MFSAFTYIIIVHCQTQFNLLFSIIMNSVNIQCYVPCIWKSDLFDIGSIIHPGTTWKMDINGPEKSWKTHIKRSWKVMENYFQCSVCTLLTRHSVKESHIANHCATTRSEKKLRATGHRPAVYCPVQTCTGSRNIPHCPPAHAGNYQLLLHAWFATRHTHRHTCIYTYIRTEWEFVSGLQYW